MVVHRPHDSAAASDQSPAPQAAAGVAPSLYENFAVLRHPRTRADHLPSRPTPMAACNSAQSRLVADSDGVRAWIVPGKTTLCLTVKSASGWASQAGVTVETTAAYRAGERPLASLNADSIRKPHRRVLTMLFPDGSNDVRLRRGAQIIKTLTVENNAILSRPRSATSISWRAPDGAQRHLTLR